MSHAPIVLLTVQQAATRLALSRRSVWALLAAGRLTAIRLSRRCTRIEAAELDAFIEATRQGRAQ